MGVPQTYGAGDVPLVTLSATEIGTGVSRIDLYAGNVSGARVLTNVAFPSETTVSLIPNSSYANAITFDLSFSLPQTIASGAVIATIPLCVKSGSNRWADIDLTGLHKVGTDGTITHLCSGAASKFIAPSALSGGRVMGTILNCPQTTFKSGEKLRFFVSSQGDTNGANGIACDPMGRDPWGDWKGMVIEGGRTQTVIQVPFKVEL